MKLTKKESKLNKSKKIVLKVYVLTVVITFSVWILPVFFDALEQLKLEEIAFKLKFDLFMGTLKAFWIEYLIITLIFGIIFIRIK